MSGRRLAVVVSLLVLAVTSVLVAPSSDAQVLPDLPPLPAPPADGNLLADILGPSAITACDAAATAYALVGPIAAAQLPPELQGLVVEVDPYLALITYACGFLVTTPTGFTCAADAQINDQVGLLGLPVSAPGAVQLFYETAAGIEHAFLRAGVDIGTTASQQLATALGCGVPAATETGPPKALPVPAVLPAPDPAPVAADLPGGSFAAPALPSITARPAADRTTVTRGTVGQLGALRYPVRRTAALLLGLPLVLLAAGVAASPWLRRRLRPRRPTAGPS